jgi:hypothetical protein
MPHYYFDCENGHREIRDEEGVDLANLEEARSEAIRAIDALAKGKIPEGDRRDFRLAIREEAGPVFMVVSLSLRVERK